MEEGSPPEMQPIHLRIEYVPSDFVHACRLYQKTTTMHRVMRVVAVLAFLISCWVGALMLLEVLALEGLARGASRLGPVIGRAYHLDCLLPALSLLAILLWINPFRSVASWLNARLHPQQYAGPLDVTIDQEGLFVKTDTAEARQHWRAFSRVLESDRVFLLVYGNWLYAILPKRAFASEDVVQGFRVAAQHRIGAAHKET